MNSRRLRNGLLLVLASGAVAASAALGSSSAGSKMRPSALPALKGPTISTLLGADAKSDDCQYFSQYGVTCYGPADLAQAYDFPSSRVLDGRGQTIVVVDVYGSPSIESDLAAFDEHFDIPPPPRFDIVGPNGSGDQSDPYVQSWAIETSLDVEYAHAMAPGANIVLAVAPSDDDSDILQAEQTVVAQYPGAVISQSFGGPESGDCGESPEMIDAFEAVWSAAEDAGGTVLAAAGDEGATTGALEGCGTGTMASFPASDPLVTAVGGTEGNPYPSGLLVGGRHGRFGRHLGRYGGEQVWNEPVFFDFPGAGGGAPSSVFEAPRYQEGYNGYRTTPDVSYDAAGNGGVEVFTSPYAYLLAGTSVGTPQWAAIIALANEARSRARQPALGPANPALYALARNWRTYAADFHDITQGTNSLGGEFQGFSAGRGYDIASGLGTPDVGRLVRDLVHAERTRPRPVPPVHAHAGSRRHRMEP